MALGKLDSPMKKWNCAPVFCHTQKSTKKGLKVEHTTLSYYTPRRKHWGNLLAIGLCNEFLGFTLKAKTKILNCEVPIMHSYHGKEKVLFF